MDMKVQPNTVSPETARAKEDYLYNAGYKAAENVAKFKEPKLFNIGNDNYVYYNGELKYVEPKKPNREINPDVMRTFSLDGLVDFIRSDVDGYFKDPECKCIVRIASPTEVQVLTPVHGYWKERATLAVCEAPVPSLLIGKFIDIEAFQIMLQATFAATSRRDELLQFVGSMKKEQNIQTADDGVSQRVQINQGVSTTVDAIVKNPFCLTPIRTFQEVDQPESPFVLRFREDGSVALFLGDGGAWEYDAVKNIKSFLEYALDGCNVIVIG